MPSEAVERARARIRNIEERVQIITRNRQADERVLYVLSRELSHARETLRMNEEVERRDRLALQEAEREMVWARTNRIADRDPQRYSAILLRYAELQRRVLPQRQRTLFG